VRPTPYTLYLPLGIFKFYALDSYDAMKEFFKVTPLEEVLAFCKSFEPVGTETVPLAEALDRVLSEDLVSGEDLPPFPRSTMDGFAVRSSSTFGSSEANPAFLAVIGYVAMGQVPEFSIGPGQAARIATGGMLPKGADAVVMVEHTEKLDESTIEVYRSVAPGQHVMEKAEDFAGGQVVLPRGKRLRPQEMGLLAAFGRGSVKVHLKPVVGILSTGDEIVPIDWDPAPGQIRDVNTTTLSALVAEYGGVPVPCGIVADTVSDLKSACARALEASDMVLISGGSSVGARDYTIEVLSSLPESRILAHGITISPGKPTILAKVGRRIVWGLPGHVTSAMVVFSAIVCPFLARISGESGSQESRFKVSARLGRNVASAQGRIDFIRVRLRQEGETLWADPVLGKSGLLHTMVAADGLIAVGMNEEGLEKGDRVEVLSF
jgi:molybdopterin molybdotransferase